MASIPDRIIGHEKQIGQLISDIAKKNVAHAYLFAGPKHLGKFTIARWFASRLLADHLPAAEYATVKDQAERLIHPDLLVLDELWMEDVNDDWATIGKSSNAPQQHRSKAPAAKTDTISIEDIRALSDRMHATGDTPYFCCLIRSAERMQTAAANAFLKLLEEPPPRVVFVLTTEGLSQVLPTVISRTRVMHFKPLMPSELSVLADPESDDGAFALHLAGGAPGKLIRLLNDPDTLRANKQLHAQAKQFWQGSSGMTERLRWLLSLLDEKKGLDEAILHLGLTLREYPDPASKIRWTQAYFDLLEGLQTNAHKALLLERFALAVGAR
jgi:DNA polymerase-3 subunit delta'